MKIWDRQKVRQKTEGKTEGQKDKARYRVAPQLKMCLYFAQLFGFSIMQLVSMVANK